MKKIIAIIIMLCCVVTVGYFTLFSNSAKTTSITQAMLDTISSAVQTQDREQIKQALGTMLAEDAQATLEVRLIAPVGQKVISSVKQQFNKSDFVNFVDTTLYSLHDYHITSHVTDAFLPTGNSFTFAFTSDTRAKGMSVFSMHNNYPFTGTSTCSAQAHSTNNVIALTSMDCVMEVH